MLKNRETVSSQSIVTSDSGISAPSSRAIRGLPSRLEIVELAKTYLEIQHRLWPQLVQSGEIPTCTDDSLSAMADRFEQIYASPGCPTYSSTSLKVWKSLGTCYSRYSDEASNHRSLNQQLKNELEKAARESVYVPWEFVLVDAAISGTTTCRPGYQKLKEMIVNPISPIEFIFIDELGRANRDQIESLRLGNLIKSNKKQLIGASDSFDSRNDFSKWQLTIFSMLHEMFIDQLRSKVDRGMTDAFTQGSHVYDLGFGYRLVPRKDPSSGALKLNSKGQVVNNVEIDDVEAEQVRRLFTLYACEHQSTLAIARLFNKERVGDRKSWTASQIRSMLRRETYHGKIVWRKTKRYLDRETGRVSSQRLPKANWLFKDAEHLRIIDEDLWEKTCERRNVRSQAYQRRSGESGHARAEVSPKGLFQLFCKCCGEPMWMNRGGERPVVRCNNGRQGVKGCSAKGGKSLKIIEESILNTLLLQIHEADFTDAMVRSANEFLVAESQKPGPNMPWLQSTLKKKEGAMKRLADKLEEMEEESGLDLVIKKIGSLNSEVKQLRQEIAAAKKVSSTVFTLDKTDVDLCVSELKQLLQTDLAVSASLLGELVGRVRVSQNEVQGKRPEWMAEFHFGVIPILARISREKHCPSTDTLELLSNSSWTNAIPLTVPIRHIPSAERLKGKIQQMAATGMKENGIAAILRIDSRTVQAALRASEVVPEVVIPVRDLSYRNEQPNCWSREISIEVVRLHDEEFLNFKQIALRLGVGPALVSKAYHRHEAKSSMGVIEQCFPSGRRRSPNYLRIDPTIHRRILGLLKAGELSDRAIARELGVSSWTVRSRRRFLESSVQSQ